MGNKWSLSIAKTVLIACFFLCVTRAWSTEFYSAMVGPSNWTAGATWSPSGPPVCGDTIYIQAGHTVEVSSIIDYTGCGQPLFLEVYGDIWFNGGGSKLRLPAGSGLQIHPGGSVYSTGGGGGSSKTIEIGSATVWSASDGTVTGPADFGTPLGVSLLSFSGAYKQEQVLLNWEVATSLSGHYIIEKSSEGNLWAVVAEVGSTAALAGQAQYIFSEDVNYFDQAFYRLSFISSTGEVDELATVIVMATSGAPFSFNLIPNPSDGDVLKLAVSSNKSEEISAVIMDGFGRTVYNAKLMLNSGNHVYELSSNLDPSGMYYVTLHNNSHVATRKVVIGK